MADLGQANKLLSLARRRSNAAAVELDVARRKFWDVVDGYPADVMLIGGDRDAEIRRLQDAAASLIAGHDALQAENTALRRTNDKQQQEIAALRRNPTSSGTDEEFDQLLRENGQLRRDCERLRADLRSRAEHWRNPIPPVPPVPRR